MVDVLNLFRKGQQRCGLQLSVVKQLVENTSDDDERDSVPVDDSSTVGLQPRPEVGISATIGRQV